MNGTQTITPVLPPTTTPRASLQDALGKTGWRITVALVWALAMFGVLLLVWIFLSSFKTTTELFDSPFGLPAEWRFENFVAAWNASNFGGALRNSVILVVSTGVCTVAVAAPAAYALSRFGVFGSRALTMAFALGVGIPVQLIILPLYTLMNDLYLVNSLEGVWLLYVATSLPFAVFFLTGFFISLPKEMEEAASIDGAGPVRTFFSIMLPLARSGIVTLLILNVIQHWGETIIALVFLQTTELETLPLALLKFLQRLQYTGADWGQLFAGVAIVIGPVLLIYLWLGRRIIEGLTLGADR
jgi:multiple sugar transport system permease protein/N-acetylglucosamine transport system permease protein